MKDWNIFRCILAANRIALSTQCTDMEKALHLEAYNIFLTNLLISSALAPASPPSK